MQTGSAAPWPQGFDVLYCQGLWQTLKCVGEPRMGLLVVGFDSLDPTIQLGAGRRAY